MAVPSVIKSSYPVMLPARTTDRRTEVGDEFQTRARRALAVVRERQTTLDSVGADARPISASAAEQAVEGLAREDRRA